MRIVEFQKEAKDWGDAPSFVATNVRRMFLVAPSLVRITLTRIYLGDNGLEQQRVSGHIDIDISEVGAIVGLIREGLAALECEGRKKYLTARRATVLPRGALSGAHAHRSEH